jgi:ankyrin repeat protein
VHIAISCTFVVWSQQDEFCFTPLCIAAKEGHEGMTTMLARAGAEVNYQTQSVRNVNKLHTALDFYIWPQSLILSDVYSFDENVCLVVGFLLREATPP